MISSNDVKKNICLMNIALLKNEIDHNPGLVYDLLVGARTMANNGNYAAADGIYKLAKECAYSHCS